MPSKPGGVGANFVAAALKRQIAARDELILLLVREAGVEITDPSVRLGTPYPAEARGFDPHRTTRLTEEQYALLRKVLDA